MYGLSVPFLLLLFQVSNCTVKVNGNIGDSVTLPCTYDTQANGVLSFCWGRGKVPHSKCTNLILSSYYGDVIFRESPRYQLLSGVKQGNISLTILNAQKTDAGVYGCRVEIPGWFNDQKINIYLIMEEASMRQFDIQNSTESAAVTICEDSMTAKILNAKSQENFNAFIEAENIGRIAIIFFLTIILILFFIHTGRKVLMRRMEPQQLDSFTLENIYDTIPVAT